jgi:hypothetical protein
MLAMRALARARLELAAGEPDTALAAAREAVDLSASGVSSSLAAAAFEVALASAYRVGDGAALAEFSERLDRHPLSRRLPWGRAVRARFRALAGEADQFAEAERLFREAGMRFHLAVVLLEHADAASSAGDGDPEPLLAEARAIFDELRAAPWLERADALAERLRTTPLEAARG